MTAGRLKIYDGSTWQYAGRGPTGPTNPAAATVDINFVISGGNEAISTGSKGFLVIPFECVINSWVIFADVSGSIVVDVKKCDYSGYPTTSSIAGTEKPTLSSAQKNTDTALSSWTTNLSPGDILEFVVDSATTVKTVNIILNVTRTVTGTSCMNFIIDNSGFAIESGGKGYLTVPFSGPLVGWTLLADTSGSIVIDVKKATYAAFPTTTSMVGAAAKPTLSAATKNIDSDITDWTTTAVTSGDIIEIVVDSAATVTRVTLQLLITRSV